MGWLKVKMPGGGWASISKSGAGPDSPSSALKLKQPDDTWAMQVAPGAVGAQPLYLKTRSGWQRAASLAPGARTVLRFPIHGYNIWGLGGVPSLAVTSVYDGTGPFDVPWENSFTGEHGTIHIEEGFYPEKDYNYWDPVSRASVTLVDGNRFHYDSMNFFASSARTYVPDNAHPAEIPRYRIPEHVTHDHYTSHTCIDLSFIRDNLPASGVVMVNSARVVFDGYSSLNAREEGEVFPPPELRNPDARFYLRETTGLLPVYLQTGNKGRLMHVVREVGEYMTMDVRTMQDIDYGILLASGQVMTGPTTPGWPYHTWRAVRDISADEFSYTDHLEFSLTIDHIDYPPPPLSDFHSGGRYWALPGWGVNLRVDAEVWVEVDCFVNPT